MYIFDIALLNNTRLKLVNGFKVYLCSLFHVLLHNVYNYLQVTRDWCKS